MQGKSWLVFFFFRRYRNAALLSQHGARLMAQNWGNLVGGKFGVRGGLVAAKVSGVTNEELN
jgi:hypothetical protein